MDGNTSLVAYLLNALADSSFDPKIRLIKAGLIQIEPWKLETKGVGDSPPPPPSFPISFDIPSN